MCYTTSLLYVADRLRRKPKEVEKKKVMDHNKGQVANISKSNLVPKMFPMIDWNIINCEKIHRKSMKPNYLNNRYI